MNNAPHSIIDDLQRYYRTEQNPLTRALAIEALAYLNWVAALKLRIARLEAAIHNIDAHATPLGGEEFVETGYLVSVGSLHRALGVARQGWPSEQDDSTPPPEKPFTEFLAQWRTDHPLGCSHPAMR